MAFNTNDPTYNTPKIRVQNFRDFSDEKQREEDELKKISRNSRKNELDVYSVADKFKKKYNKVTHKLDDVTKNEVDDDIEAIEDVKESRNIKSFDQFKRL